MTSDEKIVISVVVAFLLGMLFGLNMCKEDIKMCTLNRTTTGENK